MNHPILFSDIVRHPSFQRFAALLRLAMRPSSWRYRRLSHAPLHSYVRNLRDMPLPHEKTKFMEAFTHLLVALNQADQRLTWTEADMDWLVAQLDADHGPVVMALLLAFGSAPDRAVMLHELAALTGEPESTWRERCQRGDVPGADRNRRFWSVSSEALIHFILPSAQASQLEQLLAQQRAEMQEGERNDARDESGAGVGSA